jgi:glucose/arabinose dehydrogenase
LGFALKRRFTLKNLSSVSSLVLSAVFALVPGAIKSHAQLPVDASSGKVLATGLNDPRGLVFGPDGALYIAEAGIGGTTSTVGTCTQGLPPLGPYKGGPSARISKLAPTGTLAVLATGLPSFVALQGDIIGVADVAFLDGQLYALIAGGGCSHGNPDLPNGIVKVDRNTGKWTYITDLSTFYMEHPAAYSDASDFEPDGVPYSMIAHDGRLFAVEPNHGTITATTTDGSTSEIIDVSFSEGHIVPTSIAANDNNLYIGNLGQFPITSQWEKVITLSQDLGFIDTTPGFATEPADVKKFRIANSRAGFTTIVSLKFGPDGLLYALELSDTPNGFPNPGDGKVLRLNADGTIQTVVTGLKLPGGMTFGPDKALYISNAGDLGPGMGQIVRIAIPK